MAISPLAFNPVSGWQDTTNVETKPANESRTRLLLQQFHNQARDYINNTILPVLNNVPTCRAHQSTGQSIPSNTNTTLTFDTKDIDTDNIYAANRFTIKTAGIYLIVFNINFESNTANMRLQVSNTSGAVIARDTTTGNALGACLNASTIASLGVGDYIQANVNLSAALSTSNVAPSNFQIVKVG